MVPDMASSNSQETGTQPHLYIACNFVMAIVLNCLFIVKMQGKHFLVLLFFKSWAHGIPSSLSKERGSQDLPIRWYAKSEEDAEQYDKMDHKGTRKKCNRMEKSRKKIIRFFALSNMSQNL